MSAILPELVASIAESKIGLSESSPNRGKQIQEFFDADDYYPNGKGKRDDGYAWCAAFVCRVVQLAMKDRKWTFHRPTTPGAWAFEKWSLAQDNSTWLKKPHDGDIKRGDIVVFRISHIGIATGPPDKNGIVPTVEGNTNAAGAREGIKVMRRNRSLASIRSRIRFRV